MSKHTRGPWRYEPRSEGSPPYVVRGREGGFVVMGLSPEREEADARLIAAAPTLLAALETVEIAIRGEMIADMLVKVNGPTLAAVVKQALATAGSLGHTLQTEAQAK